VFINVYHGRSSCEIGAEFGLNDEPERRYGIGYMIRAADPDEVERFRLPVATTIEKVKSGVRYLASIVRRHGGPVLVGDRAFFIHVKSLVQQWWDNYVADAEYSRVQPEAAQAFREKDYKRAAKLYECIKGKLTPAELKKLEYAQRRQ